MSGCEKEISLNRTETCDSCRGTGCAAGTTAEVCPDCRGTGQVRIQRGAGGFAFTTTAPCSRCSGTGKIIHQPCTECHGAGSVRKRKTIQVSIPAGIDNGQTISVRSQGHAGKNGGPAGDLLITITVKPHDLFRREGTSVLCDAPITFAQAVLGAELEIPTIDGKVKYELPEGTQSGTTFRLKGKGIPSINGRGRGDQYVTVYTETPKNLNKEQKEALKKFAEAVGDTNYEERRKFFKKFKK
jgi:molecular chaperone DnaJ